MGSDLVSLMPGIACRRGKNTRHLPSGLNNAVGPYGFVLLIPAPFSSSGGVVCVTEGVVYESERTGYLTGCMSGSRRDLMSRHSTGPTKATIAIAKIDAAIGRVIKTE